MFRRKKSKKKRILFIGFLLLVLGFTYGYFKEDMEVFHKPNFIKSSKETEESSKASELDLDTENQDRQSQQSAKDDSSLFTSKHFVSEQTKLILKTYYTQTRDTAVKEEKLPLDLIGRSIDELEDYLRNNYTEWDIRECSQNRVELYRALDGASPGHFIVRERNGYIVVYRLDEYGNEVFYKQTDVSVEFLSDIDRKKLKEGIIVKGTSGVEQILQDYSS